MICPKCRDAQLVNEPIEEHAFDAPCCPKCNGMWLDGKQVKKKLKVTFQKLNVGEQARDTSCECPACRNSLFRFRYPNSMIRVDMCSNCNGIWFDSREYLKIEAIDLPKETFTKHRNGEDVPGVKGVLLRFIDDAFSG